MKSRPLFLVSAFLIAALLLVVGVLLVRAWLSSGSPNQPTINEGPLTGPPAPWPTQLSTAFDAARRDLEDPVLIAVPADPVDRLPKRLRVDQAFEMEFLFLSDTSKPSWSYIDLNDAQPEQTVHKRENEYGFIPVDTTKRDLHDYLNPLSTVKLSARDVYSLTVADASATLGPGGNLGYLVTAYLHLFPRYEGISTTPAVWSIYYFTPGPDGLFGPGTRVDYLINAETGAILRRTVEKSGDRTTPSPVAP